MKPIPSEIEAEFTVWYAAYPRKIAREAARKAYRRARKLADAPTLLAGVRAYTAALAAQRANGGWAPDIAHPATWLNGHRWLDENPAQPEHEAKMIGHYRAGEITVNAKAIARHGRSLPGVSDQQVRVMVNHGLLTREQAEKAGYAVDGAVLI